MFKLEGSNCWSLALELGAWIAMPIMINGRQVSFCPRALAQISPPSRVDAAACARPLACTSEAHSGRRVAGRPRAGRAGGSQQRAAKADLPPPRPATGCPPWPPSERCRPRAGGWTRADCAAARRRRQLKKVNGKPNQNLNPNSNPNKSQNQNLWAKELKELEAEGCCLLNLIIGCRWKLVGLLVAGETERVHSYSSSASAADDISSERRVPSAHRPGCNQNTRAAQRERGQQCGPWSMAPASISMQPLS